ncbi:AAA family ATPase [Xanthobacter versatilis]|uniref:AAA family ATPase n=1 Tax=Xanthobacter autotrophicus (strain ATCC BAA-1158 / Py2) TaxID=78245 RepID=UPI0037264164
MPTKPIFTVFPPRSRTSKVETLFSLHRDAWDDFGYKTQYQLIYHGDAEETYIGNVKILRKGQAETTRGVLEEGLLRRLSTDFCSLGQSLDYYERLAALSEEDRQLLVRALRDVVNRPNLAASFRKEPGWRTSIVRDVRNFSDFAATASVLLSRDYASLADVSLQLKFKPKGWKKAIELDFDTPTGDGGVPTRFRALRLPKRVAIIVGRNGTGKSTLLARFARVAHAPERLRRTEPVRSLGRLEPEGVGFTRIIAISYSAFDSFQIPGVTVEEHRQIARDVAEGTGRYIFCGLRDIARESQAALSFDTRADDLERLVEADDLVTTTLLKPIQQLAEEFVRNLERIRDLGRGDLLEEVLAPVLGDPSFGGDEDQSIETAIGDNPQERFLRWSTGHKIVIQIVTSLVAYAQPKAVVLLDEPETHLHPPLLAALMHSIRITLERLDAFAIVATHSPVVAQETLARHVHILRRNGDHSTVTTPKIETFGESIGEVTDEIFGLHSEVTGFYEILHHLVERHRTLEAVENQFDNGLSMQARAYVMSLIAADDDEEDGDV